MQSGVRRVCGDHQHGHCGHGIYHLACVVHGVLLMEDNIWKDALIDRAIICGVYKEAHEESPRKCLHDILVWENATAVDPLDAEVEETLPNVVDYFHANR